MWWSLFVFFFYLEGGSIFAVFFQHLTNWLLAYLASYCNKTHASITRVYESKLVPCQIICAVSCL